MQIQNNVSLKPYNTFGIDITALQFYSISNIKALKTVLKENTNQSLFIIGGGSNMLLTKQVDALVLHIDIKGIEIVSETEDTVIVKANAGENWHNFVQWCISQNYGGIENLSLIPGNVGAAPIQNIGAYGIELQSVFESCTATDIKTQTAKTFTKKDCKFGYRESVFKQDLKGQYIITSVNFKLTKKNHNLSIAYGAIKNKLEQSHIKNPTIKNISEAVIAIRQAKLPDPKEVGNSGSFFKNPVISTTLFKTLQQNFPEIPAYPISEDAVKVPAGWLIEKAGFKGKRFNNYGVHHNQALVLVNYGDATGKDILKLAQLIQNTIKRLFNISIEIEVNIM